MIRIGVEADITATVEYLIKRFF